MQTRNSAAAREAEVSLFNFFHFILCVYTCVCVRERERESECCSQQKSSNIFSINAYTFIPHTKIKTLIKL